MHTEIGLNVILVYRFRNFHDDDDDDDDDDVTLYWLH